MISSEKNKKLLSIISELCRNDTVLAFSGGVDSSLLLSLLKEQSDKLGSSVTAVTADTSLHPHEDAEISAGVCREPGR